MAVVMVLLMIMVMPTAALVMLFVVMVVPTAARVVLIMVMMMTAATFMVLLVVMMMTAATFMMFLMVMMLPTAAVLTMVMMVMGWLPGSLGSGGSIPGIDLRAAFNAPGDPGQFRDQGIRVRGSEPKLLGGEGNDRFLHGRMGIEFGFDLGCAVGAVQIVDDVYFSGHGNTS